ncbi:MAG: hypothetical protein LBK29_03060 [Oscillospiraceae bacterium]|jgi:hypothetical protein|nr:hypothetical protein [Oscillospiraceae bacterium]
MKDNFVSFLLLFFLTSSPIILPAIDICKAQTSEENEDENVFDFIKSNINSDNWILYAGIALTSISVGGLVFMFLPKNKNKISKKTKRKFKIFSI